MLISYISKSKYAIDEMTYERYSEGFLARRPFGFGSNMAGCFA
jgi:hypothetical protein